MEAFHIVPPHIQIVQPFISDSLQFRDDIIWKTISSILMWVGRLAHTFQQVDSESAPVVYNDNQGVFAQSKNPVHHNASKHIDVQYHFVRDCIISKKNGLEKIPPTDNVADGMTNCLSVDRF